MTPTGTAAFRARAPIVARRLAAALVLAAAMPAPARAALTVVGSFDPSGAGGLCGTAFGPGTGPVWVHACSGSNLQPYTTTGTAGTPIARPGESANDIDIEIAPEALMLGATAVPAGTVLVINGETGVAEIYAVDPATGAVLATLVTNFGASHVVGGAYHPGRNSFFLVQDRNGGAAANRVAEIDPATGLVSQSFSTLPAIDVNYGDLDICNASGHLLVVSSLAGAIAEFTPAGAFVEAHALPPGVAELSGIGQDDGSLETWVGDVNGGVHRLAGLPCSAVSAPDPAATVAARSRFEGVAPNPTPRAATLRFSLAHEAPVTIRIYDVSGRLVRTIAPGTLPAGTQFAAWDGRDDRGVPVRAGAYACRVTTPQWTGVRTVFVLGR